MTAGSEDPLALIIGGGGAAIGALSMLVWSMLLARVNRIERDHKEVASNLIGDAGMTVKLARVEGRVATAEAKISSLESGTLSREIFERATREQNVRLDDLKEQTKELDHKVDKIDRTLVPSPRSYQPSESPYPRPPPRTTK